MKMPKTIGMKEIVAGLIRDRNEDELKLLIFNFDGQRFGLKAKDPHLVVPIVTSPAKAIFAMKWLVCEVGRREKLRGEKARSQDRVAPIVVAITGVERLPKQAMEGLAENYGQIAQRLSTVGITAIGANELIALVMA